MIDVSSAWKATHTQPILPESFLEISLGIVDETVSEVATITCDNEAAFSNADSIINSEGVTPDVRYAFLEENMWLLDGSRTFVEDIEEYEAPGFVSGSTAVAESADPLVELVISTEDTRTVAIPGFVIVWSTEYDEYATHFSVTVKKGSSVVASTEITNNDSLTTKIDMVITEYDSITIQVHEWSQPGHRVRIGGVMFGHNLLFDKNHITNYTHEMTGDVTSSEVSQSKINFSIDNSDGRWNPLNPTGLEQYLSERQKVTVRYGLDVNGTVEWIKGGTFYLSDWIASPNGLEAQFVAHDVLGFMSNVTYARTEIQGSIIANGSIYSEPAADATILGSVKTGESYAVSDRQMVGSQVWYKIPAGWVKSNSVDISGQDKIIHLGTDAFEKAALPDELTVDIPETANLDTRTAPIKVDSTSTASVIQMIANLVRCRHRVDRDGVLRFEETQDDELTDYVIPLNLSSSYPEIELSTPVKEIVVTLFPVYTNQDNTTNKEILGTSGESLTLENPLVLNTGENFNAMLTWLKKHWASRTMISGEFRADPRLDLFDVVRIESKYGTISPVMITSIKYTYNGALWGTYTGKLLLD